MATKVVDASVIAAILYAEEEALFATARLRGGALHAPDRLLYELANICVTKCRPAPADQNVLLANFSDFAGLEIILSPIDDEAVLRLALEKRLTHYDASYLWPARQLDGELVTFDKRLQAAAQA